MKKLFTVLALTLLAVAGSFGQSIYTQGKSPFYSCSAVTATGVCAYASLPMFNYYSYPAIFTWQVTTTGSPATISTTLEGSIDGRTRLDVVTTASSTTITSATMNFVAADVGKTLPPPCSPPSPCSTHRPRRPESNVGYLTRPRSLYDATSEPLPEGRHPR